MTEEEEPFNVVLEKATLVEVKCEKCHKHSGWALVCVCFVCDDCKAVKEGKA